MEGVNETKNGNIARSTKLQSLTGYSNTNRNKHNMVAYREVEKNMISAQNELDEAYTALNDAQSNYMKALLTDTQLLSQPKSYEITRNSGKNVYDRMVTQSKQNLLKLGKIYKDAEIKLKNAKKTFNEIKQKFNTFKQNFENSKKPASSSFFSWKPWKGSGKTHKRHHYKRRTNKRNKTKRNRN